MKKQDLMDIVVRKTADIVGFDYAAMAAWHGLSSQQFRHNATGFTSPTAKRIKHMLDNLGIPFDDYFDAWYEAYGKPNMRFRPSKRPVKRRCQKLSHTEQKMALGYLLSEIHKEMCRRAKDCTWRGIARVGSDVDNAFRNYCVGKANPSYERLGRYMSDVGWSLEVQKLKLIKYGLEEGVMFLAKPQLPLQSRKDFEAAQRSLAAKIAAEKMNFS